MMYSLAIAALSTMASASTPPAAPQPGDAQLLSGVVAAAAAHQPRLEVLSAADVRTATDFEATRQSMGCSENSCLIEIAHAMDARVVVSGVLGQLGEQWVLQLTLLDVVDGRPLARESLRAPDATSLAQAAEATVQTAFSRAAFSDPGSVRVVVLDFTLSAPSPTPPPAQTPTALSPWFWGGAASAGVGVAVAAAGAGLDAWSVQTWNSLPTSAAAKEAQTAYATSDSLANAAVVAYGVGGALVAAGVGVVVVDAVVGDAEEP